MSKNQNVSKEKLIYIFQVLEGEQKVGRTLASLDNTIKQMDNHNKSLNLKYNNQMNLLRNIIISVILAILFNLIFNLNFFIGFILVLVVLFAYGSYQKKKIKVQFDSGEEKLELILMQKRDIQKKLASLKAENEVFTHKIPEQFRNLNSITELYSLLYYGQADNLKEAYNLLEQKYRHDEQMGALKVQTAQIRDNNSVAYQQLNKIHELTEIERQKLTEIQGLADTALEIDRGLKQTDARVERMESDLKYKRK